MAAQATVVRQLAPDVYVYIGDELQHKPANCLWVIFNDYVLVADANYPWGAKEILKEIRKTSSKPVKFVFNTHYHHDHSFGNSVFVDSGATIISTAVTADEMKSLGQKEWDQNWSGQSLAGYRREYPTKLFDDTLVFDDGCHRVELINMGQAHTKSDGIAFLPKEKILVTGDLFVNGNPWGNNVADPHANYDRWLIVLDSLAAMNITTVVPGHGEVSTVTDLRRQREFLADMLKQVREGIRNGLSKETLLATVNLSKHPVYGPNKISIERSVGAMYDHLKK
jgi:glyoxylase-like metal-dependent hydrolase (beta-lactamase superfamily II)